MKCALGILFLQAHPAAADFGSPQPRDTQHGDLHTGHSAWRWGWSLCPGLGDPGLLELKISGK